MCAAQVLLHLGAVPVGLPREGFPVEQRLDDDHLSLETTRLDRSGCGGGEQRSEHEGPLRIERRTVRVPELIPDLEVAVLGHLVPMVGLGGEVAAVVDGDRVTRSDLHDGGASPGPEHGDVVDDRQQADPRPGRGAGAHEQIGAADVDVRRARQPDRDGDRYRIARPAPRGVDTTASLAGMPPRGTLRGGGVSLGDDGQRSRSPA